jgi:magnesium chelatase family protein
MLKNLAKTYSAELDGVRARIIEVETDLNVGLHAFNIVGLADKALNEAKERVNSAIKNAGAKPPNRENRKITVNLAPADVKKTGAQYDVAICIGYLAATKQIAPFDAEKKLFLGELALDGRLRPVAGALNIAERAKEEGFDTLYLPAANANEAAAIGGIAVIPVESLTELVDLLEKRIMKPAAIFRANGTSVHPAPDFSEIKGQENAKRALAIAAAGGHNILMVGPPGVGKSLSAQALAGILPDLAPDEAVEITKIWSAAGLQPDGLICERPFRSPHHTASLVAIVGGGTTPRPGEVSLAHRGVLFLDELPEFPKNILESLRQPLESGVVHVARARGTTAFPAKFALAAAMNPCPCGFHGDPEKECRCSAFEVIRYQKKISGPLLDRIDIQIRVPRMKMDELRSGAKPKTTTADIKARVAATRGVQAERFKKLKIKANAEMTSKQAEEFAELTAGAEKFLDTLEKSHLSPRGYYRLLKTSRTIADLDGAERVGPEHLAEAFSYRLREEI